MSPTDPLAFFGAPTLDAIAAEPDEVHISVTFSWDLEKTDELFYQWEMLGVPVEVGGPAFGDRMSETFTPGMYLKEGMTITSRGCPKDCWFCDVGKCANGRVIDANIREAKKYPGKRWEGDYKLGIKAQYEHARIIASKLAVEIGKKMKSYWDLP